VLEGVVGGDWETETGPVDIDKVPVFDRAGEAPRI